MAKFEFNAQGRDGIGSSVSRKLRREEIVPGVLYGSEIEPQAISMSHHEMFQLLRQEDFHSSVLMMDLEGKKHQVLLRDVQFHPYKRKLVHLDFQQISDKKEIRMSVPLHFINADTSPGVKLHAGIATHALIELEIACLPKDLPKYIEVDMGEMEISGSIHSRQLKMPEGVKIALSEGEDPIVCSIMAPMKEEEEVVSEEVVEADADAEVKEDVDKE